MKRAMLLFMMSFIMANIGGCKSKTAQLILGKWRVEQLNILKNATDFQLKAASNLKDNSFIIFKADSSFQARIIATNSSGKWCVDEDKKQLLTINTDNVKSTMDIKEISSNKIVIENLEVDPPYSMTFVRLDANADPPN